MLIQGLYESSDQPQSLCDPSNPTRTEWYGRGTHPWVTSSGNKWHAPNATVTVTCNTTVWDLHEFQAATKQDVGSTVGELPTTEELIAQARKLLSMSPHGVVAR